MTRKIIGLVLIAGLFLAGCSSSHQPSTPPHTSAAGSWSVPLPVDTNGLVGVSCVSSQFCAAVDNNGDALIFKDAHWSTPQLIDPSRSNAPKIRYGFGAISCVSATYCVAVDRVGHVFVYEGSSWKQTAPVDSSLSDFIKSDLYNFLNGYTPILSCTSRSFCMLIEQASDRDWSYLYNGTSWSRQSLIETGQEPGGAAIITALSCPSDRFCIATDNGGNEFTFTHSNWSPANTIVNNGSADEKALEIGLDHLTSVSCVSSTFCVAVDSHSQSVMYADGAWHSPIAADHLRGYGLGSVSCASTDACLAVDANDGYALRFNGRRWSAPQMIDPGVTQMGPLSCTRSGFCMAVDGSGNAMAYAPPTKT